jgi:hypothetical protein
MVQLPAGDAALLCLLEKREKSEDRRELGRALFSTEDLPGGKGWDTCAQT